MSRYGSQTRGKRIETHFRPTHGDPCPSLEYEGRCLRGLTQWSHHRLMSGWGEGAIRQDVTRGNEAFKTGMGSWDYLEIVSQMINIPVKISGVARVSLKLTPPALLSQNPNINGLPKCALIRQLSWHKECAHAHNSLLSAGFQLMEQWSCIVGSRTVPGTRRGRSWILTKGSRLNLHKCA